MLRRLNDSIYDHIGTHLEHKTVKIQNQWCPKKRHIKAYCTEKSDFGFLFLKKSRLNVTDPLLLL